VDILCLEKRKKERRWLNMVNKKVVAGASIGGGLLLLDGLGIINLPFIGKKARSKAKEEKEGEIGGFDEPVTPTEYLIGKREQPEYETTREIIITSPSDKTYSEEVIDDIPPSFGVDVPPQTNQDTIIETIGESGAFELFDIYGTLKKPLGKTDVGVKSSKSVVGAKTTLKATAKKGTKRTVEKTAKYGFRSLLGFVPLIGVVGESVYGYFISDDLGMTRWEGVKEGFKIGVDAELVQANVIIGSGAIGGPVGALTGVITGGMADIVVSDSKWGALGDDSFMFNSDNPYYRDVGTFIGNERTFVDIVTAKFTGKEKVFEGNIFTDKEGRGKSWKEKFEDARKERIAKENYMKQEKLLDKSLRGKGSGRIIGKDYIFRSEVSIDDNYRLSEISSIQKRKKESQRTKAIKPSTSLRGQTSRQVSSSSQRTIFDRIDKSTRKKIDKTTTTKRLGDVALRVPKPKPYSQDKMSIREPTRREQVKQRAKRGLSRVKKIFRRRR
jgi:hypothetical protein